jgi:glycosyltransferase involved in cell wall biosynthesis
MADLAHSHSPKPPHFGLEKRRLRVLHIYKVFYPEVHGGIPYAIEQAMKVRPDIFEHQLLVCSSDPMEPANFQAGVERVRSFGNLFSLPIAPLYPLRLWQKMKSMDLVVLHAPFPLADLVLGFGFLQRIPLFVYWHSDIISQKFLGWLIRPLLTRTLIRAKNIFVSNEKVVNKGSLVSRFSNKIIVAPFPVEIEAFNGEYNETEFKKIYGPNIVIFVGRLVPYKGLNVLIDAAVHINGKVLIVGEGEQKAELQRQIIKKGLESRVCLLGRLEQADLILALKAADVFVLPSISEAETFGIVQIEAMAAGLPIVNTQINTAVPEIARDGLEAITVVPGDASALAIAVNKLLDDEELRLAFSNRAHERAKSFRFNEFERVLSDAFIRVSASRNKPKGST